MKPTAEERIHELNKALLFIKENHNGEIPYQFSSNEYGLWMARYANNAVEEYKESFNINKRAEMRKQAITVIPSKFKIFGSEIKIRYDNERLSYEGSLGEFASLNEIPYKPIL